MIATCCYDFHFCCRILKACIRDQRYRANSRNQYTIYTYDNFGNLVLETSGKVSIFEMIQDNQL